jgi:hypothetical protein
VSSADGNRAEHNDPEGVEPRRGVEVRGEFVAAESARRQRVAGGETDQAGVNRLLGGGAQRPNGQPEDSVGR